ncbi:PepSY domain-containing protein [Tamlana sp. 2_MG-2023]|uniref:PepSY-associated TM helix domain-containing protein n=1 Tax=unclassified Tamlana TaxID=2614803 RepID=UPI0026E3BC4B|nr:MULTISPECIES: PepSY domain-containing protein [unclassified Tamlana]MDO6759707.1 PepSY domain-containing protein [Tamlana sp. 2_MG-2023]MDO6791330.1 PepSY domain-containing protein [Tamlana sp. 1_MG-2023]
MKNKKLNQWLWKWHFIAGIIALPFIVLLAITGGVYLFKDAYEAPLQAPITVVEATGDPISFQEQWGLAQTTLHKAPNAMVIPTENTQATEFISGRFSHKNSAYINPYAAEVSGTISPKDSNMYTVRKLHGELLLGKFGTKIIELVASWMFVLIITGVYVFWPAKKEGVKAFFRVRTSLGKRIFFRDLHTVLGFWISVLLLMTLAGGMPWTDVFGGNFRSLQEATNTGFPKTWDGRGLHSKVTGDALPLDHFVDLAKSKNLDGTLHIGLPQSPEGVYIVYNQTYDLDKQQRFYFDQYSGKQIFQHNWEDVGVLMRGRMWFMAFHQGQFGYWNFLLMLGVAILLTVIALAGLISYLKRKEKGKWGTPKVSAKFKVGYGVVAVVILLAIIFPLFGISVALIALYEFFKNKRKKKQKFA